MMPGVSGAALAGRLPLPAWVPANALAHLDFVNGRYYADDVARVVGELLGGSFLPGEVVDASGMRIRNGNVNVNWPAARQALFDIFTAGIAAGMVVLVEIEQSGRERGTVFAGYLTEGMEWVTEGWTSSFSGVDRVRLESNWSSVDVAVDNYNSGGRNKMAFLYNGEGSSDFPHRFAAACNGYYATQDIAAFVPDTMTTLRLFGVEEFGDAYQIASSTTSLTYVRAITLYPAMPAEDLEALTALGFPLIRGRAAGVNGSDAVTHAITLPGSIVAGDLLLVVFSVDGNPTVSVDTGTGWTKLGQASNTTVVTGAVFWKIADGADALTLGTTASEQSSHVSYGISGGQAVEGASANGSSSSSNPPNLVPSWGAEETLWIASRSGDAAVVASAAPANFDNLQTQAGGSSGASTNAADRRKEVASLDPGPFTSNSEQWVTWTLAIQPEGVTS